MRVLVTGTSGRIGSAVARRIVHEADVIGLDIVPGEFTTQVGDVRDAELIGRLANRVDGIIHVAALLTPHVGVRSEEDFYQTNVVGTENLLSAATANGIKRFVLTSTTSVYGCTTRPKNSAVWVTEKLPPHPEDIYDRTKLQAESLCERASRSGICCVVLRMSRCFPEAGHLLATYRLYRGVDERDVADGHFLALSVPLRGFHVLNLSAEPAFQEGDCEELWTAPCKVIEKRIPEAISVFREQSWPLPRCIDRVYTIDQAKRVLGYGPRFGFAAAVSAATELP